MEALVIEAAQTKGEKAAKNGDRRSSAESAHIAPEIALAQLLRPIFAGMDSLMRSQNVQSLALDRLEKALEGHATIPEVLNDARHSLDQRNVVNRAMFDALHSELKRYKDDFHYESVVRPVVRDLLSIYDDTRELHRQITQGSTDCSAEGAPGRAVGVLDTLRRNLEHHLHYLLEVLERMEARVLPPHEGKLDKRNQKVVAREPAMREEDDLVVIRSIRPAFLWRDRLFRPEEVVVLKWGLSSDSAHEASAPDVAANDAAAHDGDASDSPPA